MASLSAIAARILAGEPVEQAAFTSLPLLEQQQLVDLVVAEPSGRRWLRSLPGLDARVAVRLLRYAQDYRSPRRDATLDRVVARAPIDAVVDHAAAIATGSAAMALWERLQDDPDRLVSIAEATVQIAAAAESTLYLLVLDPLDPFNLGTARRTVIARAALTSDSAEARGIAAEFLANAAPDHLLAVLDDLVRSDSERVRGIAWLTALQMAPEETFQRATTFLLDESQPIELRRSALVAIGMRMPTSAITDLLSAFVIHPDPALAHDAADLLYQLHRNPETAEAARMSPHPEIREIAEALLDPRRGSPAAGGSRPGDPTRTIDIFRELIERSEPPGANGVHRR
ncbi:MAG: hypothetical protein M9890_10080 [Thermomicrobiales bacterium]|nr:hypothetical protein [Thermomicrobiales bacterium]